MPKKHTPGFKNTKPQAAPHASLASRSQLPGEASAKSKTVNERLQELRISQGNSKTKATSSVSTFTPELENPQQLLQARRNQTRIAGPPPPRSWATPRNINRSRQLQGLASSRHAPPSAQHGEQADTAYRIPPLMPGQPFPPARSLRATSLRLLARNLDWHIAHEYEWLNDVLTIRMKCELLATIALLSPRSSRRLDKRSIRYLFDPQKDSHGRWHSGGEGVTHLNFGAEIQDRKDYITLSHYLKQKFNGSVEEVPEDWDEEETSDDAAAGHQEWSDSASSASNSDLDEDKVIPLSPAPRLPFFPSLTHLSLACSRFPCWWALIEAGADDSLCHLTHLDLSYWPKPTVIPLLHHSKSTLPPTETRTSNLDDHDQREIVRIFNQLGKACRKLVWLGLEGCESWILSLLTVHEQTLQMPRSRYDIADANTRSTLKADWTGVWRGLETLKCSQSWIPRALVHTDLPSSIFPADYSSVGHSYYRWWQVERSLRADEFRIAERRLEAKQSPLRFEKTPVQSWVDLEIRSSGDDYNAWYRFATRSGMVRNDQPGSLLPPI